jgi:LEA14-like dessication related protein
MTARPDSASDGGSVRSLLDSRWRKAGAVVAGLIALLVALYVLGVIGVPSAGVVDEGDWGNVSEERTEVVTTVWVNNPNPVGVSFGGGLTVDYGIELNGVRVAEGSKSDVAIPRGNTTMALRTDVLNEGLPAWWVEFVRDDETVRLDANATLTVAGVSVSEPVQRNRTMLDGETPVIDAMSAAANDTADTYTENVSASDFGGDSGGGALADRVEEATGDPSVTVGYEIERGWATGGSVDESETTGVFHLLVRNAGDVPVPATTDGVGVTVDMNDVRTFEAETGAFSADSLDEDAFIGPGEREEITVEVTMNNDRVDEWFTSHVEGPEVEHTDVEVNFQVLLRDPTTGTELRAPEDGPVSYDCDFSTAILVDDATTDTSCEPPVFRRP